MDIPNLSQSLPDYVQVKCFRLKSIDGCTSESLWPIDLLEELAGPTRTIDLSTKNFLSADGTNPHLVFAVNLELVWDEYHLQCGIYRALFNMNCVGKLKTKSIPAEVSYQLASTGKINEAIKQFCLKDSCQTVAIISLNPDTGDAKFSQVCHRIESLATEMEGIVDSAEEFSASELASLFGTPEKRALLAKVFKMSSIEISLPDISNSISMRLALKDIEN